MSVASDLNGQTFTTTIYESVIGKIVIENEILIDGSVFTTIWVQFPDGFSDEVFTVQEACEKLEL
jgi:leucyl aminopeptidase (aminopeptidase T)